MSIQAQAGQPGPIMELERVKRALWLAGLSSRSSRAMGPDHRREQRLAVDSRGACSREGSFELEPIDVLDISLRGLQFRIRQPVQVGDRVRVIVCLPGAAPCQMLMEVRWTARRLIGKEYVHQVGAARLDPLGPPSSS